MHVPGCEPARDFARGRRCIEPVLPRPDAPFRAGPPEVEKEGEARAEDAGVGQEAGDAAGAGAAGDFDVGFRAGRPEVRGGELQVDPEARGERGGGQEPRGGDGDTEEAFHVNVPRDVFPG